MSEQATPPAAEQPSAKKKKPSSARHTRAIQRDRTNRPVVQPPDAEVTERLTALIHPLAFSRLAEFHDLGLRQRLLTVPVVLALVLSMIWRQIDSVRTAVLLLEREGFLWTGPVCVSHQVATLNQPLAALSLARLYRFLYFFTTAYQAGKATDVVAYMAAEARVLGILKPARSRAPAPTIFQHLVAAGI